MTKLEFVKELRDLAEADDSDQTCKKIAKKITSEQQEAYERFINKRKTKDDYRYAWRVLSFGRK